MRADTVDPAVKGERFCDQAYEIARFGDANVGLSRRRRATTSLVS